MGAFDALTIANTGLGFHQTWLDTLSYNIANINTVRPTSQSAFQAQMVVAQPMAGGQGVEVGGLAYSDAAGMIVNDPDNPLADADGNVRAPATDLSAQMSQLIMAQRGFQASAQVTKYAQDTYSTAIGIGSR